MSNMATSYASGKTAPGYVCSECGASGVRLYRPYSSSDPVLRCTGCALKNQNRDQPDQPSAHSIGWLVGAVPTECGESFWGYTSVPDAGVEWWNSLPVEVPQ